MAALHDRTIRDREVTTAGVALVQTSPMRVALQARDAVDGAAVRAERAVRPADSLQMRPGGLFIVEDRVSEVGGHRIVFQYG